MGFLYDCIYDWFHGVKVISVEKPKIKVLGKTKYELPVVTKE